MKKSKYTEEQIVRILQACITRGQFMCEGGGTHRGG